jgi:tRNA A-37 threonylcarbamoyl transferase component Bud32
MGMLMPAEPVGPTSSWTTDKAEFFLQGTRLTKRYLRRGSAKHDADILGLIADHYQPVRYDGWTYRPLRVHGADASRNMLTMEYVAGQDLKQLFESTLDPRLFRHAGRWLGGLHAGCSADGSELVLAFNDFNCSNVVVDRANREVVSIDPGAFEVSRARPGVSLAIGALSAGRVAMQVDPRLVLRSISAYLRGYRESLEGRALPPLGPGWAYVLSRMHERKTRSLIDRGPTVVRLAVGLAEVLFWALVTWLIDRRLRVRGRRRARRS